MPLQPIRSPSEVASVMPSARPLHPPRIVVIGAGIGGLAFALACARRGVAVRGVDRRPHRALIQKATGINLAAWRLLASLGVTADLAAALPLTGFALHHDETPVARVRVPPLADGPPAYLHPQAGLEKVLERHLAAAGIRVEYGIAFTGLAVSPGPDADAPRAELRHDDGTRETVACDWLIGADGIHSAVRAAAGLAFAGKDYPGEWSVAEITTAMAPPGLEIQLFLRRDGSGLFMSRPEPDCIQAIANGPGAADALRRHFPDARPRYERTFRVSLRRVATPRAGRVWLIGDAAHVQSPVGGQGLNLALWDAITLANALLDGDMRVERRLVRRARRVLTLTDLLYRVLSLRTPLTIVPIRLYWRLAGRFPTLSRLFFRLIAGV